LKNRTSRCYPSAINTQSRNTILNFVSNEIAALLASNESASNESA
jgi:hypothetical protein